MRVFGFLKNRVLLAAVVTVLGASLVSADQNDRKDRNNQGGGQPARSSNNQPAQSFNSGNSGNSGNNASSARSFLRSSSSNNSDAARSFQSQGNQGRGGRSSGDSGGKGAQFSNKSNSNDRNVQVNSSSGSDSRQTVLGQQIQSGNQQNQQGQNNNQKSTKSSSQSGGTNQAAGSNQSNGNSSRSFGKFRGNDNARIAENDDRKNKGDNNNNRNNGGQNNQGQGQGNKGNSGQNNQSQNNKGSGGQSNQSQNNNKGSAGQNNQGQNNSGQNNQNGQKGDSGNFKRLGDNPGSKNGIPFNGKNNSNSPNGNNGTPSINNGPKFDNKNNDDKNGDRRDKDFGRNKLDLNHDGKPDVIGKDMFNHGTKDNRPGRDFKDRNFHGNDASKAAFNKWNDVWKGKNGSGKDNRDWSGKWRNGDRFVAADAIRRDFFKKNDFHKNGHNMPFQASWWDGHHGHDHGWNFWGNYASHHHHNPYYWWGWASAPALVSYCNFGWGTPYYWDYGQGEYIYCNGGNVYVNGRLYEPTPVYYAQTCRLIDQAPLLDADAAADADWMPLGVFAVTPDGENQPALFVQLAITKNGIVGGTATDQQAGNSFNVQGTVDQKTQRAIWSYVDGDNHRIVMESSINNLTQDESTGLIHYSPNDQRVVEFVRMPEPDAQGQLPMPQTLDVPGGDGPTLPPPDGQ